MAHKGSYDTKAMKKVPKKLRGTKAGHTMSMKRMKGEHMMSAAEEDRELKNRVMKRSKRT